MWSFSHKLGPPFWLYLIFGSILRWLVPMSILGLTVGAVWRLLHTMPDFRQGSSYRIFYMHAPSAAVPLAAYYVRPPEVAEALERSADAQAAP